MNTKPRNLQQRLFWVGLLIAFAVAFRLFTAGSDAWFHMAPFMVIAFAGAVLGGRALWWMPLVALAAFGLSDLALYLFKGFPVGYYTLLSLGVFGLAALIGLKLSHRAGALALFGGTLLGSFGHYLVLNTYSWLVNPLYSFSMAGWWQSQTLGIAGFPPSYLFLRNALVADMIWCGLAVLIYFHLKSREHQPAPVRVAQADPSAS